MKSINYTARTRLTLAKSTFYLCGTCDGALPNDSFFIFLFFSLCLQFLTLFVSQKLRSLRYETLITIFSCFMLLLLSHEIQ